eukprot:357008-Chlamydomonas_euryale.AAC.10
MQLCAGSLQLCNACLPLCAGCLQLSVLPAWSYTCRLPAAARGCRVSRAARSAACSAPSEWNSHLLSKAASAVLMRAGLGCNSHLLLSAAPERAGKGGGRGLPRSLAEAHTEFDPCALGCLRTSFWRGVSARRAVSKPARRAAGHARVRAAPGSLFHLRATCRAETPGANAHVGCCSALQDPP